VELDAALSRARFVGTPPAGEGNYIDNAVEQVLAAGLAWQQGPWSATLRLRHMGARALDTLNSVRSSPTTLLNLGLRYALGNNSSIGLEVFNLADRQGNDIEYYYASCTAREVAGGTCGGGINDRHVHPMEPRTVRLTWRTGF
jgi:outer membrane receptor protein involved in Fe transport